jgi:hypothetical protein
MYNQKKELKTRITLEGINNMKENVEKQILNGINNPFSSTGTPINELYGAANTTAVLANIGGGAKRIGGGGMQGGINNIRQYDMAKTLLYMVGKLKKNAKYKQVSISKLLK